MKIKNKPVIREAILFDGDSTETICKLSDFGLDPVRVNYQEDKYYLKIETLEGCMVASVGDYIIKGVEGEFYPCKPDIFKKTYDIIEEVEEWI